MTRKKGLSAAIVGSSSNLTKNLNAFLFIPENYKTLTELSKLDYPYYFEDPIKNSRDLKLLVKNITLLKKEWLRNHYLSSVFEYGGENLASFIRQRLTSFFGRSLVNFEIVRHLVSKKNITGATLFKDPKRSIAGSYAIHNSLLDISLLVLLKLKGGRISLKINKERSSFKFKVVYLFNLFFNKLGKKPKVFSEKVDVLFVLPGNHVVLMIPVFKELEKRHIKYLAVLHNLPVMQKLELIKRNVKFLKTLDFYSEDTRKDAQSTALMMRLRWNKIKWKFRLSFGYGLFAKYIVEIFKYKVENFLNFELPEVLLDYLTAKNIINQFNPKLIVTTTDPDTRVLPFINLAKKHGFRSLTIQHGAFANPDSLSFQSDKMLVWGKYYKNWFEKYLKKKSEQLVLCGSLEFDKLFENLETKVIREKRIKTVLVLISFYYLKEIEFEKSIFELIKELKGIGILKILIRTHPFQKISYIESLAFKSDEVEMANKNKLEDVLKKADLVVSCDTTAGINAICAGKDVIYWPYYQIEYMPFGMCKDVKVGHNVDEIIRIIKKKQDNESYSDNFQRKKFLKQIFYKLDCKAYLRIVKAIQQEIN